MDDLIRRRDAINVALEFLVEFYGGAFDEELQKILKKRLETLPSAPQWNPCSERLPSNEDYDETFTVTIQCEHHDGWDDYVTGYAEWTPHGWDIQSYYIGQIKVVAWMPLPKPYKESENENK